MNMRISYLNLNLVRTCIFAVDKGCEEFVGDALLSHAEDFSSEIPLIEEIAKLLTLNIDHAANALGFFGIEN